MMAHHIPGPVNQPLFLCLGGGLARESDSGLQENTRRAYNCQRVSVQVYSTCTTRIAQRSYHSLILSVSSERFARSICNLLRNWRCCHDD